MKFTSFDNWLNESLENINNYDSDIQNILENEGITAIYCGGFKPTTEGHLDMMYRYLNNKLVKKLIVFIGPAIRNGITQDMSYDVMLKLIGDHPKIEIEKVKYPSPLLTAYKYIETAQEGVYTLVSSTKGDDYKRVEEFVRKHKEGEKYHRHGVHVIEMGFDISPVVYNGRTDQYDGYPISASIARKDIMNDDFSNFKTNYPSQPLDNIKFVWDTLQGKLVENINYDNYYVLNENEERVTSSKNTHMTHIEDLVLLGGKRGIDWAYKTFTNLFNQLNGHISEEDVKTSLKYDGSPACMVFSSFPGIGQYGISTKGLFAKTPNILYSNEDIDEYTKDKPELGRKLKSLLKYLPELNIPKNEIWQGDFLFDSTSLMEDDKYYMFHPNTIVYKVLKNSLLGKQIDKAEVGVVWHTRYKGDSLDNVKSFFNTSVDELEHIPEVFMVDPYIKSLAGIITFTKEESDIIKGYLKDANNLINELKNDEAYDKIVSNDNLISLLTIYQNSLIKSEIMHKSVNDFVDGFISFIDKRYNKEIESKKTEKAKLNLENIKNDLILFINENYGSLCDILNLVNLFTDLKHIFIKKLNTIDVIETKLKMKSGEYKDTYHEGIAVSDMYGSVVKLVSRYDFSFANFNQDVVKGWQK